MPILPTYAEGLDHRSEDMKNERGFTLIELLAGMLLAAIIMGLGATSLRGYWLRQGLVRSSGEIATEMRGAQQRAMAESHPLVYGLRFEAESEAGARTWSIVRFDPRGATNTEKCTKLEEHEFPAGVNVATVMFGDGGEATDVCRQVMGASSQIAFFFARGTATDGSVTLRSPYSDGMREIVVYGVTGRAEEVE